MEKWSTQRWTWSGTTAITGCWEFEFRFKEVEGMEKTLVERPE